MERNYAFDNLKTCLSLVVLIIHASLPYMPWKHWPLLPQDSDIIPNIWMFVGMGLAFIMSAFFFISGYYVPQSYDKHGFSSFLKRKLIRMGIPLILLTVFHSIIMKKLFVGHLWYLQMLLIFSLIYALYRKYIKPNGLNININPSLVLFIALFLMLSSVSILIRRHHWPGEYSYVFKCIYLELAHFPHYILSFLLGTISCRGNWLSKISSRYAFVFLVLGVMSMLIVYIVKYDAFMDYFISKPYTIVETFFCLSFCVGLIVIFKNYCNRTNSFWKNFAKLSYGIYIYHVYFLLLFQYFTHPLHISVYIKYFGSIFVTTLVTSVFVWCIRKVRFINHIF